MSEDLSIYDPDTYRPPPRAAEKGAFTEALRPRSYAEAKDYCEAICLTEAVSPSFRGKWIMAALAIKRGERLGLDELTSLQNIAVINGQPRIYGDAPLALVQRSPAYDYHEESDVGEIAQTKIARCTVKRKGRPAHTATYTADMARQSGQWGKPGPWKQYPWRMLQINARRAALGSQFAAELMGWEVGDAETPHEDPSLTTTEGNDVSSDDAQHKRHAVSAPGQPGVTYLKAGQHGFDAPAQPKPSKAAVLMERLKKNEQSTGTEEAAKPPKAGEKPRDPSAGMALQGILRGIDFAESQAELRQMAKAAKELPSDLLPQARAAFAEKQRELGQGSSGGGADEDIEAFEREAKQSSWVDEDKGDKK